MTKLALFPLSHTTLPSHALSSGHGTFELEWREKVRKGAADDKFVTLTLTLTLPLTHHFVLHPKVRKGAADGKFVEWERASARIKALCCRKKNLTPGTVFEFRRVLATT